MTRLAFCLMFIKTKKIHNKTPQFIKVPVFVRTRKTVDGTARNRNRALTIVQPHSSRNFFRDNLGLEIGFIGAGRIGKVCLA